MAQLRTLTTDSSKTSASLAETTKPGAAAGLVAAEASLAA
jgi:hypothetical protein